MRSIRLSAFVAALVLSISATGLVSAAEPGRSAGTANPEVVPARQLAMGISMLSYDSLSTLDSFTASVGGRQPALWSMWSDWGGPNAEFPSGALPSALKARGIVPLILWQPVDPANLESEAFTYARIVAGDFDDYIREWARDAKAWGGPVVVRFAHEMDGAWFPWGTTAKNFDGNTPTLFLKAWKRIWKLFRGRYGVGATNVRFLWSPLTPRSHLYPGHKFVDYAGFTSFNWGGTKPWKSMYEGIAPKASKARAITTKPIIVAETGTTGVGGDKVTWITRGHQQVYRKLPQVAALVYFNIDMRFQGHPDWSLTSTPGALLAYQELMTKPKFQGRIR